MTGRYWPIATALLLCGCGRFGPAHVAPGLYDVRVGGSYAYNLYQTNSPPHQQLCLNADEAAAYVNDPYRHLLPQLDHCTVQSAGNGHSGSLTCLANDAYRQSDTMTIIDYSVRDSNDNAAGRGFIVAGDVTLIAHTPSEYHATLHLEATPLGPC